jgi:hypothetical protein
MRLDLLIISGFRPPAVFVLLVGVALLVALRIVPSLQPYASAWPIPLLITLAAWLAMAATQVDPSDQRRARLQDPYLRKVLERRDALEAELVHIQSGSLKASVQEMLREIDRHVIPEMEERVARHRALQRALEQQRKGQGALAGASEQTIKNLNGLFNAQKEALEGMLQKLSDMAANLLGISQETDQDPLRRAKGWAQELSDYWSASAEVFRDSDLRR